MKKILNTVLMSFLLVMVASCVDDEKLWELDDFETGALPNIQQTSNDLGFIDSFDYDGTVMEFTIDFLISEEQSDDGGFADQGDGRREENTAFSEVESVQLEVSYLGTSSGGVTQSAFIQDITSWPATITLEVDDLIAALSSLNSTDDIDVGDVFTFICGVTLVDGRVLPAFVTDPSGNRVPNYSVNFSGTLNNPGYDFQAIYFVSCSSNLIPGGSAVYDLSTDVTSTCCGLPLGLQQSGRTAIITDLGNGNYQISDILAGHIASANIDPEGINFTDVCFNLTLSNGPSVLNYLGPGSGISLDQSTGVFTVDFNNTGNAIVGTATLTPQ